MSSIRLRLDCAEYNAVTRYAEALGVSPEDIAYAALNRLMIEADQPDLNRDIAETRNWRRNNLPIWSDSAGSVHAYEGQPDDEPTISRLFGLRM